MHTLEVYHNAATLTYAASVIEDREYSMSEAVSQVAIEIADIQLMIDGLFLGVDNIFDLPADDGAGNTSWRARVLFDGVEVFSGVIDRVGGLTHREFTETWIVTIKQDAYQAFIDKIDGIAFLDDPEDFESIDSALATALTNNGALVRIERRDATSTVTHDDWYRMDLLWQAVLTVAGGITFNFTEYFRYSVNYMDGAVQKTITRYTGAPGPNTAVCISAQAGTETTTPPGGPYFKTPTLPNWTGKNLWEVLQVMHGWKARASYGAYPNRTITVDIVEDFWIQPSNPPDFTDDYEDDGDPEIWIEHEVNPDLGMAYKNEYIDTDVLWPEGYEYAGSIPAGGEVMTPPALLALYDAKVAKRFAGGEPDNETLISIPMYQNHINDVLSEVHTPDSINHPNYTETVFYCDNYVAKLAWRGEAFICAVHTTSAGAGSTKMLISRNPTNPAAGQATAINEIWPMIVLARYDVSTRRRHVMALTVDLSGEAINSFECGDPANGILVGVYDWAVRRRDITYVTEQIVLEVERPIDEPAFIIVEPEPEPGPEYSLLFSYSAEGIYSSELDASNLQLIPGTVSHNGSYFYNPNDNKIYYGTGATLRRMDLDGSNNEDLGTIATGSQTSIDSLILHPDENAFFMLARITTGTGSHVAYRVYRYPLPFVDHVTRTLIFENTTTAYSRGSVHLKSATQHLFFTNSRAGTNGGKLHRINFDGTNPLIITQETASSSTIQGVAYDPTRDKIFFTVHWDFELKSCNPDGTGKVLITTYASRPSYVEYDPTNDVLLVGFADGTIWTVNPDTGAKITQLHAGPASSLSGIRVI